MRSHTKKHGFELSHFSPKWDSCLHPWLRGCRALLPDAVCPIIGRFAPVLSATMARTSVAKRLSDAVGRQAALAFPGVKLEGRLMVRLGRHNADWHYGLTAHQLDPEILEQAG
jgi:hypothetical protein